jgi:DNA-binding response OmpR family regulator
MIGGRPKAAGSRILIIDDNLDLAENIAEILEMEGYRTEISTSAEDALPRALDEGVEFVVTDYRLPGINGAEFVRRVRAEGGKVQAVVISAYSDESTRSAAKDAGAQFLPKPLDLSALKRFVREGSG